MEHPEDPHIQEALRRLSLHKSVETSHNIVTWTVENFLDSPCPNMSYSSAVFAVGGNLGKFCLHISPQFAQDSIQLKLAVKLNREGVGSIYFRFGYKTVNGIVWETEQGGQFNKSNAFTYFSQNIGNYFNCSTRNFVIMCEFFLTVRVLNNDSTFIASSDSLEYGLPLDFFYLYNNGYLSDLKLHIGEPKFEFRAHKAILCSKSEVFRRMLSEMPENEDTLELLELDKNEMMSLILYIYTGNFKFWLQFFNPSVLLYDYADKFEIGGLKTFLQPTEITLAQTILVVSNDINFEIVNFNTLEENNFSARTSPLYCCPHGTFFLYFFLGSSDNMYHVLLEPSEIWDFFSVHVNITISHTAMSEAKSCELKYFFDPNDLKIYEMGTFSRDLFNLSSSSEDTLSVSGEWLVSRHLQISEFYFRILKEPFLTQLDAYGSLLDSDLHADLKLIVEDKEYFVHKFILAARLKCFKDLLDMDERVKEISMDDLTTSTIESLLCYIYTGQIKKGVDHLLGLLPVWKTYGNDVFGGIVFRLLNDKMDVKNICKIIRTLYSLENLEFFDNLKIATVTYLCRNFMEIEPSEYWKNTVTEDEDIAYSLLCHMSDEYKKTADISSAILLDNL